MGIDECGLQVINTKGTILLYSTVVVALMVFVIHTVLLHL